MKKTLINKKLIKSEKGSVMMEYLVLNLIFILTYVTIGGAFFGDVFFAPGSAILGNYGILGNSFIRHYNMMLDLISMPYP